MMQVTISLFFKMLVLSLASIHKLFKLQMKNANCFSFQLVEKDLRGTVLRKTTRQVNTTERKGKGNVARVARTAWKTNSVWDWVWELCLRQRRSVGCLPPPSTVLHSSTARHNPALSPHWGPTRVSSRPPLHASPGWRTSSGVWAKPRCGSGIAWSRACASSGKVSGVTCGPWWPPRRPCQSAYSKTMSSCRGYWAC